MSMDKYYILVDAPPSEHADDLLPNHGHAADSPNSPQHAAAHDKAAHPPTDSYTSSEIAGKTKLGGGAAILLGGAVTLIGIPLLILPGPGMLAVGGGIALMTKGAKTLFAKQ